MNDRAGLRVPIVWLGKSLVHRTFVQDFNPLLLKRRLICHRLRLHRLRLRLRERRRSWFIRL